MFNTSASSASVMLTIYEEYGADNVTVIVEWTEEEGVSYNITINPSVPKTFTGSTSVQLIVSYNTEYNVTLEAVAVCHSVATNHTRLFYGEFSNFSVLVHNYSIRVHLFNEVLKIIYCS